MRIRDLLFISFFMLSTLAAPARAHLMVARHGTLNFVDNAVFMVISIPISAFADIDQNRDGDVTMLEFNRNREAVLSAVQGSIFLTDDEGRLELQGVLLSPVTPHDVSSEVLTDLTVMGRFNLRNAASALNFESGLYGNNTSQQTLKMSATRHSSGYQAEFVLTPATPARTFFVDIPRGNAPVQASLVYRDL